MKIISNYYISEDKRTLLIETDDETEPSMEIQITDLLECYIKNNPKILE